MITNASLQDRLEQPRRHRQRSFLVSALFALWPVISWAPHLIRPVDTDSRPAAAVITVVFSLISTFYFVRWWRS